ncbi:hypothetical protein K7X08_009099 [Anisodus acutangulus]|uniref:Plastid lipid-associated protein/fibrillin conserved domain-containing protein n=1 Tax=Anisodus acutangulus TaxID=402998 RepID=A0A9Q1RUE8_9SOLA|nr:hypothetical protein K7X08_009099 [Anisodus acutangulus]
MPSFFRHLYMSRGGPPDEDRFMEDTESLKLELLEAIAPLDRGAEATPEDQILVDQATANLVPLNAWRVAVKFDAFKIAGLVDTHKSRGSGRGQLEITYLDEELRISRGNQGNLFILRMADPSYRVPV